MTEKQRRREHTTQVRYLIPHGILIILSVAAVFHFVRGKYGIMLVYSSVKGRPSMYRREELPFEFLAASD